MPTSGGPPSQGPPSQAPSSKSVSDSVRLAAEKKRNERVQRLRATLEQRLDNPMPALEALIMEVGEGDARPDLWELLHAAAIRDKREADSATAYTRCVNGPRMSRLSAEGLAIVLMHAADFFQGVRGDGKSAEAFLERVIAADPGHVDAFTRLERLLEKQLDSRRLVELYAKVAAAPPRAVNVLAMQAFNRVLQLKDAPLSDDACRNLVVLVPSHPKLLDTLEAHCRSTKRPLLACELIERAIVADDSSEDLTAQRRLRLLELYIGEAATPASAIEHLEALLERDPTDAKVLGLGDKLLSVREIASRAAAALQGARRARSVRPPFND